MQVQSYNPYSAAALRQPRPVGQPRTNPVPQNQAQAAAAYQNYQAYQTASTYQTADTYVASTPRGPIPPANTVSAEARNLGVRVLNDKFTILAPYVNGVLTDRTPENPMDIEKLDFNVHVKAAEVKVSDISTSLLIEELLKTKAPKVPLKDVRVVFDPDNTVRFEGKVSKFGFKIPVELSGKIRALPSGELEYNLQTTKVAGLKMTPVMNALGLNVDKLLKMHDPSTGFYTTGNSIRMNIEKVVDQPVITGQFRGAKTNLGNLHVMVGDSMQDAVNAQMLKQPPSVNYADIKVDHGYYDGYFIKDGVLRIDDKTPANPMILTDAKEMNIQIKKGFIGITEDSFNKILKDEIGEGGDFTGVSSVLKNKFAGVSGTMYGFVPINLEMHFDKTADGRLMFTPKNPKAFGFIPLPEKWVGKKVQGLVSNGEPYGDGIALKGVGDIDLGKLKQVQHQPGYIVLESGG